jgi:hypothetical protein
LGNEALVARPASLDLDAGTVLVVDVGVAPVVVATTPLDELADC